MSRASATGTASVVAQLLAFLREPARYRSRFTVGREAIEGGHHVLRFAYGKLPDVDEDGASREELHEAAIAFVRQVCLWEGATHYQVLCLREDAPRGAVKANYRLLMALIHPDRPDASHDPWPADAAPRANHAYEVLSDESRRREYDAELARRRESSGAVHATAGAPHVVLAPNARRWPRRLAYAIPVLAVLVAGVLAFELLQGDDAGHLSLARGWSDARARALMASAERPRYLGSTPTGTEPRAPEAEPDNTPIEIPLVSPILRSLRPRAQPAVETVRPGDDRDAPPPRPTPPAVASAASHVEAIPLAPEPVVVAPAKPEPPVKVATAARPESVPVVLAQSSPAAKSVKGLAPQDIETVVVRLIDSYESGRTDALMALMDPDRGFFDRMRTREAFSDFFEATKSRHLRITKLDWQVEDHAARARGMALVQADYVDAGPMEKQVDVEMDLTVRDGKARITRLSLFPYGP